jgi:hypothetical protein
MLSMTRSHWAVSGTRSCSTTVTPGSCAIFLAATANDWLKP